MSDDSHRSVVWAPWRMQYIREDREDGCIFCNRIERDDDRNDLILHRGEYGFIIMNLYPYNNGHLMAAPNRHLGDITEMTDEESGELFSLVQLSVKMLKNTMNPHGFNIGINMGKVAGAGVEDHIHVHIVPRWMGDTNFMPVVGEVKVISEHILATYDSLLHSLNSLIKEQS